METMELCVTACEKFSNNNEVLPLVRQPLRPVVTPAGGARTPVPTASAESCWGRASEGGGWCCLQALIWCPRPALERQQPEGPWRRSGPVPCLRWAAE